MILKGNQRGGGRQMALHLLNAEKNDHIDVHEVSGFIASDVLGALNEAYAHSKGTKCKQFMYSLSLNPPEDEQVPVALFEEALERVEKKLGLEGQPRVVVFHEKEGRRHGHCVWSRIDTEKMKAINMSLSNTKLMEISKSIYLEQNWKMPEGFIDKSKRSPLNYTRAEWQQAKRIGRKPDDIKRELQECWAISDSKQGFSNALEDIGYYLAQGDGRGFVAVDVHGEIYSLTRKLGQKKKALEERLGKPDALPSVDEVKTTIKGRLSKLFKGFTDDLNFQHEKEFRPLKKDKEEMVLKQRLDRKHLTNIQKERWQAEELKRCARIRSGFKGIWDKLNGRYWKNRKINEREAQLAHERDLKEREELIKKQLTERQNLQVQIKLLREKQEEERKDLRRDLSHATSMEKTRSKENQEKAKQHKNRLKSELEFDDLDLGDEDLEPEI